MPNGETVPLESIQEVFRDVAMRARRLQELMELDRIFRNLIRRFPEYVTAVEEVSLQVNELSQLEQRKRLQRVWRLLRPVELTELENLSKNASIATKNDALAGGLAGNGAAAPALPADAVVRSINLSVLLDLIPKIEVAQDGPDTPALKTLCDEFDHALNGQVIERHNFVTQEIQELRDIAFRFTK
jgi:hypothetical protein